MYSYARVLLKLHWGFSVSVPSASKAKASFLLPPPTTLKGALSFAKYRGVDSLKGGSPAKEFEGVFAFARFSDSTLASYTEDVVRNVVLLFLREKYKKEKEHWYNIIPTGKVISPSGELLVVYVTDKISEDDLERMAWSIIRIGSKESLVSVESVEVGKAKEVKGVKVKTKYYFPATAKVLPDYSPLVIYADFWEGGYDFGKEGKIVRYAIPLQKFPIKSVEVEVEAQRAFEVGGEYVVVA
ncbi:MAG: type I-A CRISPR-associated protein Cas5a [Candidatus Aramenus sulfurataquae]|jgi:CRISPR-associated protein Cas5a/b/c|uniref:CRISPR-associated protein Cas5 n=2 Tax=Candidatus Aramenus sulfurataquae TaxID=1326980 RepID=A0A0F2LPS8_9CREN|nr:type I-A CRISPR-associated protein Cas5a [Candidatus Aramenus sulfurataquae]